jgi:hypothetical protein
MYINILDIILLIRYNPSASPENGRAPANLLLNRAFSHDHEQTLVGSATLPNSTFRRA